MANTVKYNKIETFHFPDLFSTFQTKTVSRLPIVCRIAPVCRSHVSLNCWYDLFPLPVDAFSWVNRTFSSFSPHQVTSIHWIMVPQTFLQPTLLGTYSLQFLPVRGIFVTVEDFLFPHPTMGMANLVRRIVSSYNIPYQAGFDLCLGIFPLLARGWNAGTCCTVSSLTTNWSCKGL